MNAVAYYLARARSGPFEDVFFGLLELGDDSIPALQEAYRIEADVTVRALIVEVVWQRRDHSTIPFLAEALGDPDPETWKQALDGLVALGTPEAKRALVSAIDESAGRDAERRDWIAEAISDWAGPGEGPV
jgi:HEAT repeat protein